VETDVVENGKDPICCELFAVEKLCADAEKRIFRAAGFALPATKSRGDPTPHHRAKVNIDCGTKKLNNDQAQNDKSIILLN